MKPGKVVDADVVVIGGGAAGLSACLSARDAGARVVLMNHGTAASTRASGFNTVAPGNDSAELFFHDTMRSGRHICDPALVGMLACGARTIESELSRKGICPPDGVPFHRRLSGGSSVARTVFAEGEGLGLWLMDRLRRLAELKGVEILDGCRAISLRKSEGRFQVIGIRDSRELVGTVSSAVVIATGGAGKLYEFTTNYESSTGDGYRLALEIGALLIDMEFVQFEPFVILEPSSLRGRGIPINLVADGCLVVNRLGQEFIPPAANGIRSYTKDELAQMIFREVLEGRGTDSGGVYCHLKPESGLISKYTAFSELCASKGVDPFRERFEIAPACHCMMGGVRIDERASTDVEGVFAAGEVAGGVHGANRLGSNGLTDALVFGELAGRNAASYALRMPPNAPPTIHTLELPADLGPILRVPDASGTLISELETVQSRLRRCMQREVGIVRSESSLIRAASSISDMLATATEYRTRITTVREYVALWETIGLLKLAWVITCSALRRRESRGVHYRSDIPVSRPERYLASVVVKQTAEGLEFGWLRRGRSVEWE